MLLLKREGNVERKGFGFGMDKEVDKQWDDSLRKLIRANPQAFILWVLGEAQFI